MEYNSSEVMAYILYKGRLENLRNTVIFERPSARLITNSDFRAF